MHQCILQSSLLRERLTFNCVACQSSLGFLLCSGEVSVFACLGMSGSGLLGVFFIGLNWDICWFNLFRITFLLLSFFTGLLLTSWLASALWLESLLGLLTSCSALFCLVLLVVFGWALFVVTFIVYLLFMVRSWNYFLSELWARYGLMVSALCDRTLLADEGVWTTSSVFSLLMFFLWVR